MTDLYRRAFEHKQEQDECDPYPLLNWLTGALVCDWMGLKSTAAIDFDELLKLGIHELKTHQHTEVWDKIMLVDFELLGRLKSPAKSPGFVKQMATRYRETGGGVGDGAFRSVQEQLGFLALFAKPALKKTLEDLGQALKR